MLFPLHPFLCILALLLLHLYISISADPGPPLPSVLLPSVFHWDTTNRIFVSPTKNDQPVEISLRVQGENGRGEKSELFREQIRTAKGSAAAHFKVSIPRADSAGHSLHNFFVKIDVTGHRSFTAVLAGAVDLRQLFLQTDKVFYRPEERVNIRALPLTSVGQLYKGPLQFQLLDPNGFRIFNKTNRANSDGSNYSVLLEDDDGQADQRTNPGFVSEYFDLPKFLRYGEWRVVAFAIDEHSEGMPISSRRFQTSIRVKEYVLPKFHVFLDVEQTEATKRKEPLLVKIVVSARFAHGMPVNGELILQCSLSKMGNSSADPDQQQSTGFLPPSPRKLLTADLVGGIWTGRVDLSGCLGVDQSHSRVQIGASVFERGTIQTATAFRDYDPFASGFELVPLRPAFTATTTKLLLYLRPLSSLQFVFNGRAELVSQCISEDKALNGLNHSSIHKLGTLVELEVNSGCVVYIIRARRELSNGNFSTTETLVVPSLNNLNSGSPLDFSVISDQHPHNRVDYVEGEVLELVVPSSGDFNYAMLCNNGHDIVAMEHIGTEGRVGIPISARMRSGPCVLYVFGQNASGKRAVDMRLFFVRTGECPDQDFALRLSSENLTVGAPLDVHLRSRPDSVALLHAYDSRLEGLLKANSDLARSGQLWSFSEFLEPDPDERTVESFARLSNLIDLSAVFAKRKEVCRLAGKLNPQCPSATDPSLISRRSVSRLSDGCFREMIEECERQRNGKGRSGTLVEQQQKPQTQTTDPEAPVKIGQTGTVLWMLRRPAAQTPVMPGAGGMEDVQELRAGSREVEGEKGRGADEVSLRDFFPEVWLFNDYAIGPTGQLDVHLNTPHSVTKWNFLAKFWSSGRADVCQTPKQSLITHRHVFLSVDLPLYVFENETVQVQITVMSDNLGDTESKPMAVCFRGLSPKVCGDVGRDGTFGESDFTRVLLTHQNPVQLKRFFVRFLRAGMHNLSFELRAEDVQKGTDWHCRDGGVRVFDRISKQIHVRKRVDVEEHYRQIVVYTRRHLGEGKDGEQPLTSLDQLLGSGDGGTASQPSVSVRPHLLSSSPDVISYNVQQPAQTILAPVQTRVSINAGARKVFNLGVELSKFVPSFPPALSTELLSAPSPLTQPNQGDSALQRMRNRAGALSAFVDDQDEEGSLNVRSSSGKKGKKKRKRPRKRESRRRKIAELGTERDLQGYSLPNLLKELAFLTYELKSMRTMLLLEKEGDEGAGGDGDEGLMDTVNGLDREWLEEREQSLGNLLSELLTFSDCEDRKHACGFGEFAKPSRVEERNFLLTTLATSLLCEQRAADEYVCGPIQFLAQMVRTRLNGTASDVSDAELGLDSHAQFDDPANRRLFLETLLVQAALDCSAYACAASPLAKESWKHLHSAFYRSIDLNAQYDVRVVAALAYMSTTATRSIMRARLASQTQNDNQAPYWGMPMVEADGNGGAKAQNLLEKSLGKSANVIANALALLAYTRDPAVFRYWKKEFDFEALSNWLVEQQDSRRQYENALDTFFASRALYQFASVSAGRQVRQALLGSLQGNLSVPSSPSLSRHFNDRELPFSLIISPSANMLELDTKGEARLLLGVRVLMEKRRRSRRDPNDSEPVSLSLFQSRSRPGFINQTVTIITHTHLVRSLQIEHGLFTGFTSEPHLVQLLNSSIRCQAGPRVSPSAVQFVLSNLTKELPVVYSVIVMEPQNPYSPTDLAPIAISANHHHLPLGQLIILPDNLDFGSGADQFQSRKLRSVTPAGDRRLGGREWHNDSPEPEQLFPSSDTTSARSFLTQLHTQRESSPSSSSSQQSFVQEMVQERPRQPQSDVVETVCLQNGVCTCAETTCTLRCSSCARLTFREICQNIYSPEGQMQKFVLTFRLTPPSTVVRTVKLGPSAEYTVLENVRVLEWQSAHAEQPEHLTIWVRNCNVGCLNLLRLISGKTPRFILIGDPLGLFDEGDGADPSEVEDIAGGELMMAIRAKDRLTQTHYVMHDNDRLMKSVDCYDLFGRVGDEVCSPEELKGEK